MEGKFCWMDGVFHRENELITDASLLHAGTVVSELVRTRGTRLAFFREHYEHLQSRLNILGIKLSDVLTAEEMRREAVNLINKNRYFNGNSLQITIIHEIGSVPEKNHCLMECSTLEHPTYVLNRKGYLLGLYDDLNIPLDRLSGNFAYPTLIDFFARRFRMAKGLDDCILFNQRGHMAGSMDSTIFFRIRDKLHTPPFADGAMRSVMRDQVLHLLAAAGDPVNQEISLRSIDIEKAEEIFLANTLDGIRWVVAVDRFRYYNNTGANLVTMLNEKAFGSA